MNKEIIASHLEYDLKDVPYAGNTTDYILLSIAISLKRIANAKEREVNIIQHRR